MYLQASKTSNFWQVQATPDKNLFHPKTRYLRSTLVNTHTASNINHVSQVARRRVAD